MVREKAKPLATCAFAIVIINVFHMLTGLCQWPMAPGAALLVVLTTAPFVIAIIKIMLGYDPPARIAPEESQAPVQHKTNWIVLSVLLLVTLVVVLIVFSPV